MAVGGTATGLLVAALGGGKTPGWAPAGLPRGSVADGADAPGLGNAADGGVETPDAGGAVAVPAFGCAG